MVLEKLACSGVAKCFPAEVDILQEETLKQTSLFLW